MGFKQRERILLVAAVICLAAWAADQLVVTPLADVWKARDSRLSELTATVDKGRSLVSRQASLESRWKEMLGRSLPADRPTAESEALRAVSRWSDASRLGVSSQKPDWVAPEGEPTKLQVQAEAQGSMEEIARFLYELERDPLAFHVDELDISTRDNRGGQLRLKVRFSGLVLKEQES